jgi:hypothetical protein
MTTVEEKPDKNKPLSTPPDSFFDPWTDWKPQWNNTKKTPKKDQKKIKKVEETPHSLQERHSPTQASLIRLTPERHAQNNQRRIVDARLWEAMTPMQQDAAIEIALGCESMGRGMGFAQTDLQRIPGSRGQNNVGEFHGRLINTYIEWTKLCHRRKVSHAMILDVLVFGIPLAQCDRDRRVRKGSSRKNLLDGLNLYCEIRRWPV